MAGNPEVMAKAAVDPGYCLVARNVFFSLDCMFIAWYTNFSYIEG